MSFEKCCNFYPNSFKFCAVKKNYSGITTFLPVQNNQAVIDAINNEIVEIKQLQYPRLISLQCI